jgi:hypothetical protein
MNRTMTEFTMSSVLLVAIALLYTVLTWGEETRDQLDEKAMNKDQVAGIITNLHIRRLV